MDANDAHRHGDHDPADPCCLVGEDENDSTNEHPAVEHRSDWSAPGLEEVVRDRASEDSAEDASATEQKTPVLIDEAIREVEDVVRTPREVLVPLHDRLTQEARAELDDCNGQDDGVMEHHLHHLPCIATWSVVAGGSVFRVEGWETGFLGSVLDEEEVHHPEYDKDESWDKEDPCEAEVTQDGLAPVIGEVDAERDQDSEDRAEHATFPQMEPRGVDLDDRDGAEALEVHVQTVEDREHDDEVLHADLVEGTFVQNRERSDAHEGVHYEGSACACEDRELPAETVGEGAVQDERDAVDGRADAEDRGEGVTAHERAVTTG